MTTTPFEVVVPAGGAADTSAHVDANGRGLQAVSAGALAFTERKTAQERAGDSGVRLLDGALSGSQTPTLGGSQGRVLGAGRLTQEQILACLGARPGVLKPVYALPWYTDRVALRDVCGRRRSPATLPDFRRGKKPGNAGRRYAAEPLTDAEVLALMDGLGGYPAAVRDRALIIVLWRSGLRIHEALLLNPFDLDRDRNTVLVRRGKGGKTRYAQLDSWGFDQLEPWLEIRAVYPPGPLFCTVEGPTKGGPLGAPQVRTKLKALAALAGISKNVRPHQLRHSLAVDLMRRGTPLSYIQASLGHANPATTATYLAGIGADEGLAAVAARPAPLSSEIGTLQRPDETP